MSDDKASAAYHPFSSFEEWQEAQEYGVADDQWEQPGKIQGASISEAYVDEVRLVGGLHWPPRDSPFAMQFRRQLESERRAEVSKFWEMFSERNLKLDIPAHTRAGRARFLREQGYETYHDEEDRVQLRPVPPIYFDAEREVFTHEPPVRHARRISAPTAGLGVIAGSVIGAVIVLIGKALGWWS